MGAVAERGRVGRGDREFCARPIRCAAPTRIRDAERTGADRPGDGRKGWHPLSYRNGVDARRHDASDRHLHAAIPRASSGHPAAHTVRTHAGAWVFCQYQRPDGLLGAERLCRHHAGCSWDVPLARHVPTVRAGTGRWARRRRVGRKAALVRRQGGNGRLVVLRRDAVAGRSHCSASPPRHRSVGHLHRLSRSLDLRERCF